MNPSSPSEKTPTPEPAQAQSSQKELPKTGSPSDTLLEVIKRTPLSSQECGKAISELLSRFEQGRIDAYLQGSEILCCLKDSDAIQTTYGYYGTQTRSKWYGSDDTMASSTYFYTIKNQMTGACTRLETVFKVYNIQGLGGKNINDMHETCLFFKFGNLGAEATSYSYHDGGRGHTVWSHGRVKNVLEMVAGELDLQRDEGDQVVRELLDLFWGLWPDLWDLSADLGHQEDSEVPPSLGMIIMKELEVENSPW